MSSHPIEGFGARRFRSSSRSRRRHGGRRRLRPLLAEALEERMLLATWTVDNASDDPLLGDLIARTGSLRFTLNNAASGDVITFDSDVFNDDTPRVIFTGSTLNINNNVDIQGPGTTRVLVERFPLFTPDFPIFTVSSGVTGATISSLAIAGGTGRDVPSPPEPFDDAVGGGGIYNFGTLTVSGSVIIGNTIRRDDPNRPALGGGIYNDGGTLTVLNTTLAGNTADLGGGLYNHDGTVTVTNSTLSPFTFTFNGSSTLYSGNSAIDGGALFTDSDLTVNGSTIRSNSADEHGGGLYNLGGTVIVQGLTQFLGNSASQDGGGGYNNGDLTIDASAFAGNFAGNNGGGLFSNASLTITNSTIGPFGLFGGNLAGSGAGLAILGGTLSASTSNLSQNFAYSGGGGGLDLASFSQATLDLVSINNNTAQTDGGGIRNAGTITVNAGSLSGNVALTGAGGAAQNGMFASLTIVGGTLSGNVSNLGDGGAIRNLSFGTVSVVGSSLSSNVAGTKGGALSNSGSATISASTLLGNVASNEGGGLWNEGFVTALNSTLHGNTAPNGGGVSTAVNGTTNLTNATLAANHATAGAGGGVLAGAGSQVNLNNTLVATNTGATATGRADVSGPIQAGSSSNLIGDGTGLTGITNGSQGNKIGSSTVPIDAKLGPLAFNGGLTQTVALLPGSPAIDAGNTLVALFSGLSTDQRGPGSSRIAAGGSDSAIVDIGAFEVQNYVVTTAADEVADDDQLSLREALGLANLFPTNSSRVSFASGLAGPIALNSGLNLNAHINLAGPGAANLTLQGGGDANGFSVLSVGFGTNVIVSGLTITDGRGTDVFGTTLGGALLNLGTLAASNLVLNGNAADQGGAIFNTGTLSVLNSTLSANIAGMGGAVYNVTDATINDSTIAGNTAYGDGGGLFNAGTMVVRRSTLTSNSTNQSGGGIANSGTLQVVNSTLQGNTAETGGGGIAQSAGSSTLTNATVTANRVITGTGGGLRVVGGSALLNNTIIAANFRGASPSSTPDDVAGTLSTASASNLFGTGGAGGLTPGNSTGNLFNVADPRLGPLANNGGPTQTVALLLGSPAIDAGNSVLAVGPDGLPLTSDQRGGSRARIAGGQPDIGAFEVQVYQVNTLTDDNAPNALLSLREAIAAANADTQSRITFQPGLTGTISIASALPTLTGSVSLEGPDASLITVRRTGIFPFNLLFPFSVFTVGPGATASIKGLTIRDGGGTPILLFLYTIGGGISNFGNLTLDSVVLTNNSASAGGGIYNSGTLTVKNSTLRNNTAGSGGGIQNDGALTVIGSTLNANTAGGEGGGLQSTGSLEMVNSTIHGNTAGNGGGLSINASGPTTLTNVTITANRTASAFGVGGGLRVFTGSVVLRNTIVAANFRGASPSSTPDDVAGTLSTASASNLFGTGGAGGLTPGNSTGNLFNVVNPGLGVLANHRGPTQTVALLSGSPAIDAGNDALAVGPGGLPLTTDQRGKARKVGIKVDIGAYEFGA